MLRIHSVPSAGIARQFCRCKPVFRQRATAKHRTASACDNVESEQDWSKRVSCLRRQQRRNVRLCALDRGQQLLEVAAAAATTQDTILSAAAWIVVIAATAASLSLMSKAFFEAKSAIERRDDRQKAKEQEDQQKEDKRQQMIKKMFERL